MIATTGPHPAALPPDRLLADCDLRFTRRSGPGGQNRNKVETAVVLTHQPTGIVGQAGERRSQAENRAVALFRLRLNLAIEVRTNPVGPSPLWESRLKGRKIPVNPAHDDFPALVAEALDFLHAAGDDPTGAAASLGVSTSQFVRLLATEPRALAGLNARRESRGLHPLR